MSHERLAAGEKTADEQSLERTLRPRELGEYVGQERLVDNLKVFIRPRASATSRSTTCCSSARPASARRRSPTSSPTRWARRCAPPPARCSSAPATSPRSSPTSSPARCCSSTRSTASAPTVEEILYPALEDFQLDLVIGQGPAARTVKIELPRFTLVGATTRAGLISAPLRARFGIVHRLDFYPPPSSRRSSAARPTSSPSSTTAKGSTRSRAGAAARRGSPTACSAGCATSPRWPARAVSTARPRGGRSRARGRRVRLRRARPRVSLDPDRALRRRAGGDPGARRRGGRGRRHARGSLRAVPAAGGLPAAHAARPRRHPPRLRAPRLSGPPRPPPPISPSGSLFGG